MIEFGSFNEAVDTFFSSMEEQKQELKAHQQETQALKKIEAIRGDHESRLKGLEETKDVSIRKAELIEENLELVIIFPFSFSFSFLFFWLKGAD